MNVKRTFIGQWLLPFLCAVPLQLSAAAERLVILNWDDYLDDELIQGFEQEYDTEIVQILYSSDEDRTARLANSEASGYDLIITSGVDLAAYAKRGWLAPLDEQRLSHLDDLDPKLREAFPAAGRYAVPYFWGTLGIIYRRDLVQIPITSWKQLYSPAIELQGRISMLEDGRDLVSMGLKALGYSANSADRREIEEVEALVMAQKPFVRSYRYMALHEDSEIFSGKIVASMAYSGDALEAIQRNSALTYILPQEGGNIWIDYLAISSQAQNPRAAYHFLNYIGKAENAALLAQQLNYASPNIAANDLLPADFLNDPVIYPDQSRLENSEYYRPLAARVLRQRNQVITRALRKD